MPGATFDDELTHQLADVSAGGVQLFAELDALDLLPLSDHERATKQDLVTSTLALADLEIDLPPLVAAAFEHGVLGGGVAFKTRRYWQLCYLIEFAAGFLVPHARPRAVTRRAARAARATGS